MQQHRQACMRACIGSFKHLRTWGHAGTQAHTHTKRTSRELDAALDSNLFPECRVLSSSTTSFKAVRASTIKDRTSTWSLDARACAVSSSALQLADW